LWGREEIIGVGRGLQVVVLGAGAVVCAGDDSGGDVTVEGMIAACMDFGLSEQTLRNILLEMSHDECCIVSGRLGMLVR